MVNYTFSVLSFDEEAIVHFGKDLVFGISRYIIPAALPAAIYFYIEKTILSTIYRNMPYDTSFLDKYK